MMGDDSVTQQAFNQFAAQVVRSIAMRNANLKSEEIAQQL
jgi:ATP-binding protein involved in chromosome partitioning